MRARFVIVGAGALGSILAAHLARAGHEVTVVARGRRAEQLAQRGVVLRGLEALAVRVAVAKPSEIASTDTLVLATKAIDTEATLATLRHVALENAFSLQNGVLKNRLLAEAFGRERVLGCMADFSGELEADGVVKFTRNVCLHLGDIGGAGGTGRANAVSASIEAAGIRSAAASDIVTLEWSKFVGWIAQLPLAVLTRRLTWEFLSDTNAALVIVRAAREAKSLADAEGITAFDAPPLPVASIARSTDEEAVKLVTAVGQRYRETAPEHRMSAQQDALRGSPLELEETLGYALERAQALGVAVPTLTTLYRTVRAAHPVASGSPRPFQNAKIAG